VFSAMSEYEAELLGHFALWQEFFKEFKKNQ
jgi:hypothetical protein